MQNSLHRFCTGAAMPVKMLSLCMLTCTVGTAQAQSYKALHDKVSLQFNHANAGEIVKSLQQQTPYTFVYDPEYLQQCQISAVKFAGTPLNTVLEYLDYNSPVDIEMTGASTIAIKRGRAERPANRAQGRLTGKVLDTKNEPIPGVTVAVNTGAGTVTNIDGTFDLPLEAGTYDITFSFISYDSHKITGVEVTPKSATPINVVLKTSNATLKGVTVTGTYKRASVEGLYAIKKNSAGMIDGISAEQIGRTPDKNVGEVLKRVTGLSTIDNRFVVVRGLSERYNQAILNGQVMPSTEMNRKNFNYEIIPSNVIENVTVVKTLTPDRSAEFGGGLVEVNTLDIPTETFFNINVGASYNDKTTGKTFVTLPLEGKEYMARISDHRAWMGKTDWNSKKELADAAATWDKSKPYFQNNWKLTSMNAPVSPNFQIAGGKVFNSHFGMVASVGYRNTLATQEIVYARDGFSNYEAGGVDADGYAKGYRYGFTTNINGVVGIGYRNAKNKVSYQTLYMQSLDQQLILIRGNHDDSGPNTTGVRDLAVQNKLFQHQLKGEHALGNRGIKVKWNASYMTLDKIRPDNRVVTGAAVYDSTTPINQVSLLGASGVSSDGTLRWWSRVKEKNFSWDLAVSAPFKLGPSQNLARIGYAGWNKDRSFYVVNSGSIRKAPVELPQPLSHFFDDSTVAINMAYDGDEFAANVSLNALYAMLDNQFGKFRLVWGVRAENLPLNDVNQLLKVNLATLTQNEPDADVSELMNRESDWHIFPSANLIYSITPAMNFRLAYAESIIRPDIRELSYFREYDWELGGEYLSLNAIRSSRIKNFDFRYEWYPAPGDIISGSLFMKKIAYPMEIVKMGTNRIYNLKNNKSADNYGLELEVRKSFAFTRVPVLKNFSIYGNFTYLDSWVRNMEESIERYADNLKKYHVVEKEAQWLDHRPQSGASTYMLNAGLYYDMPVFSVSMNYNYISNKLFRASDDARALYEQPLNGLDGQIAIRLLRNKAEIRLGVANILNAYSVIYQNIYEQSATDPGFKPTNTDQQYQDGKDFIDLKVKPGRTYNASILYRF
ncbi:Outer membrane receptor proteins, mostly Fe transport [Chitinophaga jiangningensis]|uniref:Outer membrane receptor proteins, mostly Fe transport n=1 Tax=Chitinophaga jiangningensis TaxID=1419482 RepID=A0A1M7DPP4_9BACT|nr:TonB-dependent receptor [Chitinophaga jiangningensis]SHL81149.1 Outer membrane receptor proteins, mostly Fe transport [Chitinophaga jiangningensis]